MANKSYYLYQKDDSYVLFDRESMSFFLLPFELGSSLSKISESERSAMIEKALASKRNNLCKQPSKDLSRECSRLILCITQFCNLACKYCYADAGTYGDTCRTVMSPKTAKNAIDKMISIFPDGIKLIQFFGGEPLLNYEIIEDVCSYCDSLYKMGKIPKVPQFVIATNGTIMNDSIIDLFNKYNINVTISLDGPKDVNDKQRVYQNSTNSVYDKAMSTIDMLNEKRKFGLTVEVTMTKFFVDLSKSDQLRFLDFLNSKKIDSIHIVPVVVPDESELNIDNEEKLKNTVDTITDYSLETLISNNPLYVSKAADLVSIILSKQQKRNFCTAGITNFAIDTQGDIYGCFMLINPEKRMCMGNVNDPTIDMARFNEISQKFRDVTYLSCEECTDCYLRGFCSNCVAASFIQYGVLNKPLKNSCIAQKAMFERIGYHMAKNNIRKSTAHHTD